MEPKPSIPTLMRLVFGERAGLAQSGASARLVRWSKAFEKWLGERKNNYPNYVGMCSARAWAELLSQCGKLPWEITERDVELYREWLEEQGYAGSTVRKRLTELESFYDWCVRNGIDPECEAEFNPAKRIRKPKVSKFAKAELLSPDEVIDLLGVIREDNSALSKRDYAFFLTRLQIGIPLAPILKLRWSQIHLENGNVWVTWGQKKVRRVPLPAESWAAIQEYLIAAGRLGAMQPLDYIFAPLKNPPFEGVGEKAEDWNSQRGLPAPLARKHLKTFGRLAGIPEEKLKLTALRHTAALLRLEAGDDVRQIQEFLCRPSLHSAGDYLRALVERPAARRGDPKTQQIDMSAERRGIRERKAHRFQPWERMTHGRCARRQPPEELEAILKEGLKGLKEEIEGLQTLSQGLLELFDQVEPVLEQAGLAEVYARAAVRLGELIEAERFLAGQRKDDGFEEFLARRLQIAKESGNEPSILPEPCNKIPPTPLIKAKSRALRGRGRGGSTKVDEHEAADAPTSVDGEKEDAAGEGKLTQGIASLRLVLRRTLRLALEAERPKERIYLTDVYRMVCGKLIALLKMEATAEATGRSRSGVILEEVLKELLQEWGIQFEADKYSSSTSLN